MTTEVKSTKSTELLVILSPMELSVLLKYISDIKVANVHVEDIVDLRKAQLIMKHVWQEYMKL